MLLVGRRDRPQESGDAGVEARAGDRGRGAVAVTRRPAVRPGLPWPMGATVTEDGVNVAVLSEFAEKLELCLFDERGVESFDDTGEREVARVPLPERTHHVFHGRFPELKAGQVYGLRAHGPWLPERGHRFNPAKLLLDPYAKALTGRFVWDGPNLVERGTESVLDPRDSAPFVPKAVVVADSPPVPENERPGTPWDETVIYEAHVKGLTKLHPAVPAAQRGTYLGLAHPAVLEHLVRLGVTAVELLPVQAFLDERRLHQLGLTNYWGYNPVAVLAAEPRYAHGTSPTAPLEELRAAIKGLHGAGLEVILDGVLNHTAETDAAGPTLSLRGLDNRTWYRLEPADMSRYVDHAGCGNTLNLAHPRVLQLALDALRHWAGLGVDGFRFDLATVLGRGADGAFDPAAPFFQAIAQDPVLGRLKLIAEPWDIGPGGYQPGRFPPPFAEWNDRFRDGVRRFWRGDEAMLPELAARLLASADRYDHAGRKAWASVSFVAAHDGFTLQDVVSYGHKHNEANGEHNRDGHHDEASRSWGVEGPSADPAILALRARQRRNLLATLLLAQGTPMLLMGDEAGRSQAGNNNAYCQDNPVSWYRWDRMPEDADAMIGFVARLTALRRAHPALRRRRFLHGREQDPAGTPDVVWLAPDGEPMGVEDWREPAAAALGLLLNGAAGPELSPDGAPAPDSTLLLLLNARPEPQAFTLPRLERLHLEGGETRWRVLLDSARPEAGEETGGAGEGEAPADAGALAAGTALPLDGRSLVLLTAVR